MLWAQGDQGPNFRTLFSAESDFPRKIPRNLLKKRFFKTFFRGKLQFFPTFFRGKFSADFSLEKMYEKSAPDEFAEKNCPKCIIFCQD
jgi:hypothetical protein